MEDDAGKSVIWSRIEPVFTDQKSQTGLFIQTVDITRATMRIELANIIHTMHYALFLEQISAASVATQWMRAPDLLNVHRKPTMVTIN